MKRSLVGPLVLLVLLTACGSGTVPTALPGGEAKPPNPTILLATTTSTQDSGLLDLLVPDFEEKTGYTVKVIAVGTGAALAMGERGDADVLLVHAPAAEMKLVESGDVVDRRRVMHNDFVIVGPAEDPAQVRGMTDAVAALKQIAQAQALFLSRGDDSGTHKKEKALWQEAGVQPAGAWYQESGQGMGATLKIASEKGAYTLTDRGTYLHLRDNLDLVILVEGDDRLQNIYHVMVVNPQKHPGVNAEGARAFADYLTDPQTQKVIGEYGKDRFGQPLFFPDAGQE
ncbi:MAG: tungsten ABC transporter substrate-binding protein [Chloroflexi bacterium]|nr:MAG: tungsten ABC transporter substrate-binding protein [Chloroflexota bacterium]